MVGKEFWQVELLVGMGPLVLGADEQAIQTALIDLGVDTSQPTLNSTENTTLLSLNTRLTFSQTTPRILTQVEVSDARLRFATLSVIGKRAHEIIGIFKISRKETLWTLGSSSMQLNAEPYCGNMSPDLSRELLSRGTLWIKKYGLGLTLREGLVATVHLCDLTHVPRNGVGRWTKEQQMLSEVSEVVIPTKEPTRNSLWSAASRLFNFTFVLLLGLLVWWAVFVQREWDELADVPAVIVGLAPAPPHPLPDKIAIQFVDSNGVQRLATLGVNHFEKAPKMGEEVRVRFLRESPEHVLGPVASRDIGFAMSLPYGVVILLAYSLLQLLLQRDNWLLSQLLRRSRR